MSTPGKILTFYSYKGGTGRTMALANVAVLLARRNRGKVLMVDWDLEAPGLHNFFRPLRGESKAMAPERGVLELFEYAWSHAQADPAIGQEESTSVWDRVDFGEYVVETGVPSLDLMPAGRFDEGYGARVGDVPWQELHERSPLLFKLFAERLAAGYSYVLIDSRTGLTDAGDVCSTLLPDQLVLVFTPNSQSLDGVLGVARRAIAYRSHSDDLRPLLVFPLASRVDTSEDDLRQEWRHGGEMSAGYQPLFEAAFEEAYDLSSCDLAAYFDEIQIQHVPRYAYGEQIAVRDEHTDRLSIARSYEQLTEALVQGGVPWGLDPPEMFVPDAAGSEPLLVRIKLDRDEHREIAAQRGRQNLRMLIAEVGSVAAAALIAFLVWLNVQIFPEEFASVSNELLPILVIGVILGGGIEFLRRQFGFDALAAIHARLANALERECTLFEGGAGPYSRVEDPLALLVERYSQIKMQGEDALLEQGMTAKIGRIKPEGEEGRRD